MKKTAQELLDSYVSEAQEKWSSSKGDIQFRKKIELLVQGVHKRIIFAEAAGILTTPIEEATMLAPNLAGSRKTALRGKVCLPRLGANDLVNQLRANGNQVKIITPNYPDIVSQLKRYGISEETDGFEGIYPPLVTPQRLQQLLDETLTPEELVIVVTPKTENRISVPKQGTTIQCEPWQSSLHTWNQNQGLLAVAEKIAKPDRSYIPFAMTYPLSEAYRE